MMNLKEIAEKLEKYLNGDPNLVENTENRPPFNFLVKANGFHFDSIVDPKTQQNSVFVFVDTLGGSINPIPNIQETNYTIPVTMYYPIKFKDEFYDIGDYLADIFVGKIVNFGIHSGSGLCNISLMTYGEIEELDLRGLSSWVRECYNMPIEINEPYMTLSFNLFISSTKNLNKGNGSIYGNEILPKMSFYDELLEDYLEEEIESIETPIVQRHEMASEQILNGTKITNRPTTTANTISFEAYVKNNDFWKTILEKYFNDTLNKSIYTIELSIPLKNGIGEPNTVASSRNYYIDNAVLNIKKGSPLTMSLSFVETL